MAYYKEIEIGFEDLLNYINEEGLTEKEVVKLNEAVKQYDSVMAAKVNFSGYTIMDEIAAQELSELIKQYGPEQILSMVKAGQGVTV